MSKFLLLNKSDVIIDIVDEVRYVKKNENNLVVLCHQHDAQGYIGSDNETIYPKIGTQFRPSYDDIAKESAVDELPEGVVPLRYKYDWETCKIVENEDPYPADNTTLTTMAELNTANLEYLAMMTDINL